MGEVKDYVIFYFVIISLAIDYSQIFFYKNYDFSKRQITRSIKKEKYTISKNKQSISP